MITSAEAKKIATKVFNEQVKAEEKGCLDFIDSVIQIYAQAGSFGIRLDLTKDCHLKDHDSDKYDRSFPQIHKYVESMCVDIQKSFGYDVLLQREGNAIGGKIHQIIISFK